MIAPSADEWLKEAKAAPGAEKCGMYLFHNGTVRATARARVRESSMNAPEVCGMLLDCSEAALSAAEKRALAMPGVYYVKIWINRGELLVGDDIMMVLIGGDIRRHVVDALESLVEEIKTSCVSEQEIYKE